MNLTLLPRLLQEDAVEGIGGDLDLWPAIYARLQTSHQHSKPKSSTGRRALGRAFAVVVVAAILISEIGGGTSAAHAAFHGWLQQFGLLLVDRLPAQSTPVPPGVAEPVLAETGGKITYIGISEAQPQLSFAIRIPGWMPAGLALAGAYVFGPNQVRIQYYGGTGEQASKNLPAIGLMETVGAMDGGYVFPASRAQNVRINGNPATFIQGAWHLVNDWDSSVDVVTLAWQADGLTYMLQSSDAHLSREQAIQIAESLRSVKVEPGPAAGDLH